MNVLNGRLDKFSDIEHMQYLKDELLPKVRFFTEKLKDFVESNEEVKEIIRKFDESISIKVNKIEFRLY